jgi:hypothetical protein
MVPRTLQVLCYKLEQRYRHVPVRHVFQVELYGDKRCGGIEQGLIREM